MTKKTITNSFCTRFTNYKKFKTQSLFVISFLFLILLPSSQFASAISWSEIVGKVTKTAEDFYEEQIRNMIKIGYYHAVDLAKTFGYDFSNSYFESYVDSESKDLTLESVLLSVIFDYDKNHYYKILSNFPILRQFEIDKRIELIEEQEQKIKLECQDSSEYCTQVWEIAENNYEKKIVASYADQSVLDDLDKKRSLCDELTITGLQSLPAYDKELGEPVTLDHAAKKFTSNIPAIEGSDLEKDPVRASALILLDPKFVLHTNIIETKDGNWISIKEALVFNIQNQDVTEANLALDAMDLAFQEGSKVSDPCQRISTFLHIVDAINTQ